MDWRKLLTPYQDRLIESLRECIRIPSVYADDGSGHPYGQPVHDCLQYMLKLSEELGFATGNCDDHVGWCEYGEGEEMVAVLGHLDVVPAGEGWTVAPYGGDLVNDRVMDSEDLEKRYSVVVVGRIPDMATNHREYRYKYKYSYRRYSYGKGYGESK